MEQDTDEYPKTMTNLRYMQSREWDTDCLPSTTSVLCTRKRTQKFKSSNNVVVINRYDLPLCIDGWNDTSGECYNKEDYANDAIGWESDQGRWNGELFLDDFDSSKIILRPLRDIVKGEQIYTWYGPLYCCDPQHQVDQMAI